MDNYFFIIKLAMTLSKNEINFYRKNGYLVKENLISKKEINSLLSLTNKIVSKEKRRKNKIKNQGGTQNYKNYHFVYNSNSLKNKQILRLNNPQNKEKKFYDISRNKKIINIVKNLIGGTVRFHLGKLNFKLPNKKGGEIAWHQDWAFYPHTNDDLITVGIYLEKCNEENGPLKVIPGTHLKSVHSHHGKDGNFIGMIKSIKNKVNINKQKSLLGNEGTVVFFHCRTVHGSGLNETKNTRPLLLFGYRACDALPLINDGNSHHDVDYENYEKNIIVGKKTLIPRCKEVPVIIPLPKKKHYVSIYQLQKNK